MISFGFKLILLVLSWLYSIDKASQRREKPDREEI